MPDHLEVETQDLQDSIDEERKRSDGADAGWIRYVGLSTALLAVFAAIGALQSGSLVNEALIHQIKASDTWEQYQASRQKDHVYTIALNGILDASAPSAAATRRAAEYRSKIADEGKKEAASSANARALEQTAADELAQHHRFEYSVALIQVAIALGAVAALSRLKAGWFVSLIAGAAGVACFVWGVLGP